MKKVHYRCRVYDHFLVPFLRTGRGLPLLVILRARTKTVQKQTRKNTRKTKGRATR